MKTDISIPDDVSRGAERYAKKMRPSRSQPYTKAIVVEMAPTPYASQRGPQSEQSVPWSHRS